MDRKELEKKVYGKNGLGATVSERVETESGSLSLSLDDLAHLTYTAMYIEKGSARTYIKRVTNRKYVQFMPNPNKSHTILYRFKLEKLEILLDALHIPKNDDLITTLKEVYCDMDYPPGRKINESIDLSKLEKSDIGWITRMYNYLVVRR